MDTMDMNTQAQQEMIPEIYDETGVIGPGTKLAGNITTKGHLDIQGAVKGDIEAKGNVIVSGNINGKIKCSSLLVQCGNLQSEVVSNSLVSIKEEATLTGKTSCKDITIAGTVHGDITATGKIALPSTAVVKGNITASAMGMEIGAKLDGRMTIE